MGKKQGDAQRVKGNAQVRIEAKQNLEKESSY